MKVCGASKIEDEVNFLRERLITNEGKKVVTQLLLKL